MGLGEEGRGKYGLKAIVQNLIFEAYYVIKILRRVCLIKFSTFENK
jgi:hypothetical protein